MWPRHIQRLLAPRQSFLSISCRTSPATVNLRATQALSFSSYPAKMTSIKAISTNKASPIAGPYNQAIVAGNTIYVSGQLPATPTGDLPDVSMAEKTKLCIQNLKAILEEAGSGLDKVVKCVVFLVDMADFQEVNGEYEKHFTTHKPARSCVAVHQLPKGVRIEIECIALV